MRIWLCLLVLLTVTSCGRREAQTERPDEVVQTAQAEERRGGFGALFGRRNEPDRVGTNIVYGSLVPEVLSLELDRTADGVIILATTQVGAEAAFDVSLRELNSGLPNEDGLISYEFRFDTTSVLQKPLRDRVLTAGVYISNAKLDAVRGIQVFAASNSRSVRR